MTWNRSDLGRIWQVPVGSGISHICYIAMLFDNYAINYVVPVANPLVAGSSPARPTSEAVWARLLHQLTRDYIAYRRGKPKPAMRSPSAT
jgi:hypothetical protein